MASGNHVGIAGNAKADERVEKGAEMHQPSRETSLISGRHLINAGVNHDNNQSHEETSRGKLDDQLCNTGRYCEAQC